MAEEIKKISLANLTYYDEKLKAWIVKSVQNGAAVTIKTDTTAPGALKSYTIMQSDQLVGTIDIPKDMVVQSGTVEVDPAGQPSGTYIVLTLANATNDKLYINVGSLVDIYTAKKNATQIQLAINSTTREISATIVNDAIDSKHIKDKAITIDKLSDAVKALIEETAKKVGGGAVYLEPVATSTGVWTATTDKIEAYENGQQVMLKCPEPRNGKITLNINDLGPITLADANNTSSTNTTTIKPMLYIYNKEVNKFVKLIDNNTTYSNATKTSNGLMSQQDKVFLDEIKENRLAGFGITEGTGAAYTVNIEGLTTLVDGTAIAVQFHNRNISTTPTINVNGLSSKQILRNNGTALSQGIITDNSVHILVYANGVFKIAGLLGEATPAKEGLMSKDDKINLNNLQKRIQGFATTAGTNTAYTLTIPGISTLNTGAVIYAKIHTANGTNPTINVNGSGAKSICKIGENSPIYENYFQTNSIAQLLFDGTRWVVIGYQKLATTTTPGLMSDTDKSELDNLIRKQVAYATVGGTGNNFVIVRNELKLVAGTMIIVTFDRASSGLATLAVHGSTGNVICEAKPIYFNGSQVDGSFDKQIKANQTSVLVYNGANWLIVGTDTRYDNATQSKAGLMSSADKTTVDSIPTLLTEIEQLLAEV